MLNYYDENVVIQKLVMRRGLCVIVQHLITAIKVLLLNLSFYKIVLLHILEVIYLFEISLTHIYLHALEQDKTVKVIALAL